jgi:hypothetical protein
MQGLIGLAAVFYVLKDLIQPINEDLFLLLIVVFVTVSLIRVFGVILDIESLKILSGDLFAIIITPYTLFVGSRIIITEVYPNFTLMFIIPFYIFLFSLIYMIFRHYELKLRVHFNERHEELPQLCKTSLCSRW